eukprot:CAMPEP_0113248518 /NCGR_PEP_ID=MMETSP0008_2-20120614/10563_1 /TAXON_ID=97485 /ORGANISM="Prymnesium parvum" /LENGTH=227 /DNA_ID=CAMNT_0000096379 /DNA_START=140 /DNA_END=819 /DNA_ORIENTATION=- /assembly_acc=CAM_ASM_000153
MGRRLGTWKLRLKQPSLLSSSLLLLCKVEVRPDQDVVRRLRGGGVRLAVRQHRLARRQRFHAADGPVSRREEDVVKRLAEALLAAELIQRQVGEVRLRAERLEVRGAERRAHLWAPRVGGGHLGQLRVAGGQLALGDQLVGGGGGGEVEVTCKNIWHAVGKLRCALRCQRGVDHDHLHFLVRAEQAGHVVCAHAELLRGALAPQLRGEQNVLPPRRLLQRIEPPLPP